MPKKPGSGYQEDATRSKSGSTSRTTRTTKTRNGGSSKGPGGGSSKFGSGDDDVAHYHPEKEGRRSVEDRDPQWTHGDKDERPQRGGGVGISGKDNQPPEDRRPEQHGEKENWREHPREDHRGSGGSGFEEDGENDDFESDHHFDEFDDDLDANADGQDDENKQASHDHSVSSPRVDPDLPIARIWSWQGRAVHLRGAANRDHAVRRAASLGFSDICLQVNGMRDAEQGREFAYTGQNRNRTGDRIVSALARSVEEHREAGMAVHLMYFPNPTTLFMEGLIASVEDVLRSGVQLRSILLDAESNWRLHSTPDYDAACELVRLRLRPALAERGISLGFTDFRMSRAGTQLAAECDYVMPQAYSTRSSGAREPGGMQARLHRGFAELDKPIVMALAAWKMRRGDNMSIGETIEYTLDAVQDLRDPAVAEVAYWSIPAMRSTARTDEGDYVHNTPAESREIQRTLRDLNAQLSDERSTRHRLAMPD